MLGYFFEWVVESDDARKSTWVIFTKLARFIIVVAGFFVAISFEEPRFFPIQIGTQGTHGFPPVGLR